MSASAAGPAAEAPEPAATAFVLSVEAGRLEAQALLLVESLRRFGGAYASCPVCAISPRPARRIGARCRDALAALGVATVVEDLLAQEEPYGTVARLAACAWAERHLPAELLVSLDDDLFFAAEPRFELDDADFFARPVDVKGICTAGPGDPFDGYWREIAGRCGVRYEDLPWVETTVDRVRVRASYNGGMIAARRRRGLFRRTEEVFRLLRAADLAPHPRGRAPVFASTGFVGAEASRWWGGAQAAFSLAAVSLRAVPSIAPPTHNVPAHLLQDAAAPGAGAPLADAVLVHYHWLLDLDHAGGSGLLDGRLGLPAEIRGWLAPRTPLDRDGRR